MPPEPYFGLDPFLEAALRLGVPPERCLVFEDTATGIAAAAEGNSWLGKIARPC